MAVRQDTFIRVTNVSVIMPVGSIDDYLPLQLEALAGQSYPEPWELVLSINTKELEAQTQAAELAEAYCIQTVTIVDSSDLRSASHARNMGAQKASGEILLFLDGDDIADKDWMAAIVKAVAPSRAVGGHLGEDLLAVSGQEDWRPPATPGALPTFLGSPYVVSANMGLYKKDFLATGGFKEDLLRCEDIAFSWDLLRNGCELTYCEEAVIHYRHRKGMKSMMKQHYLYGQGFSQLLSRYGLPGDSGGQQGLKMLKPNGQKTDRISVAYFARRGSIAVGRVVGLLKEKRAKN